MAVGALAALVHWCVVVAIVAALNWSPLTANVAGWLVAFGVSFGGHRLLTFRDQHSPIGRSAWRFFLVSAGGFALNQGAYALLLRHGGLSYPVALGLVLLSVALATYWAGRLWAFRGRVPGSSSSTHPRSKA